MAVKDFDVDEALRERVSILKLGLDYLIKTGENPDALESMSLMGSAKIYVWEPTAIEAMEKFWDHKPNQLGLQKMCFRDGEPRFVPDLLEPSFHFFPNGGPLIDRNYRPKEERDVLGEAMLRPLTRAICYRTCHFSDGKFLCAVVATTSLIAGMVDLDNWNRIEREVKRIPRRDLMVSQYVQVNPYWSSHLVVGDRVFNEDKLQWLGFAYKLRLFLEQPYVGAKRFRPMKSDRRKLSDPEANDVVKVTLREPLPGRIPKFSFPKISQLTGRKLEYEQFVRASVRHCANGKVVPVREYLRGPRGVKKEHVVKVVR